MENLEQPTIFKFGLDETTRQNLKGVTQWAKVNAVVGFIAVGMSLLTIAITSFKYMDAYSSGNMVGGMVSRQLIVWVISLILNIILFKAAANIQNALLNNDQRMFNMGMSQLAKYFKIIGIAFIVTIILLILFFIFAVVYFGLKTDQG